MSQNEALANHIKDLHNKIQEEKQLMEQYINSTTQNIISLGEYLLNLSKQKRIKFINEYLNDIPHNILEAYMSIARTNKSKDNFQIDRRYFSLLRLTNARVTKAKRKIKIPSYITWTNRLNAFVNTIDKNSLTTEEINTIKKQFEPIIKFSKT